MANFKVDETQVALREGGLYVDLNNFIDRVDALPGDLISNTLSPIAAQSSLISTTQISGNLAIGGTSSTTTNGGIFAASLAGAVGTAATTNVSNSEGQILNLVEIVDSVTNDPILDAGSRVWGLIQAANGVADGTAIAAAASENTQISYVKFDGSDSLVLVTLTATIQFKVNYAYASRHRPNFWKFGSPAQTDIINVTVPSVTETVYEVTAQYEVGETITLSTGAGSGSGAATKVGVTPVLPATGADYKSNGRVSIYRNGILQYKGAGGGDSNDFDWAGAGSVVTQVKLKVGETFTVKAQDSY